MPGSVAFAFDRNPGRGRQHGGLWNPGAAEIAARLARSRRLRATRAWIRPQISRHGRLLVAAVRAPAGEGARIAARVHASHRATGCGVGANGLRCEPRSARGGAARIGRGRMQPLKGFRDFFPADLALLRWIQSSWHAASRAGGFEEWDGPVLESLKLFTDKSGEEIAGQLYAFEDKKGRAVALRPEMTPTLVRMLSARAGGLPKPIKWYSIAQFFRYEQPQRGRGREFFQWNVDVVGSPHESADAEVIAVAVDALRRLGLTQDDLVVRISDRGALSALLTSMEVPAADHHPVFECIDKLERDPSATQRLGELLGEARCADLLRACDEFPLDRAERLRVVLEACRDWGIASCMQPDLRIVRGLAYYTGTVFEVFARGAKLRAVAGGGRYDRLMSDMGGPPLEAVGFGMGDMVLAELLHERGLQPPLAPRVEVLVIPIQTSMQAAAREVVRMLRDRGVASEAPYGPLRLGKALRGASTQGIPRAVLVGGDEWAEGCVVVRDLASGEQRTVALVDLE